MSQQEKCPKCGSENVSGLVDSFWWPVNDWDSSRADVNLASETEMGEARMCAGCEHSWDDEHTVDGMRRQRDVTAALLEQQIAANIKLAERLAAASEVLGRAAERRDSTKSLAACRALVAAHNAYAIEDARTLAKEALAEGGAA